MTNKIGRWQGAGLLTTTLLGTSVFILPQMTVNIAGNWAMFSWIMLTLTILPVAFIFAKLSGHYPHAAGPAYFVEKAFGSGFGKTIGMIFLFAVPLGAPAALIMTYQFVEAIIPITGTQTLIVQLGFLVIIFGLNYRGIQVSAVLQLGLTLTITAVIIAMLVGAGLTDLALAAERPSSLFMTSFTAAGLAFWSFLGIEAMSHLANDFKDPKRDLIPAILIGTFLVGMIYIACTYLVYYYSNGSSLSMVSIFNALFGQIYPNLGAYIIGVLGIGGGLATVNVYTASLTRLTASFAEEGYLPAYLAKKNEAGISVTSLSTLLCIMALVLTLTYISEFDLEQLVSWVNGVFVAIYFASMLAAFKLLDKKYTALIRLSCGFCLLLIWGLGWQMGYALGLLLILYPFVRYKRDKVAAAALPS